MTVVEGFVLGAMLVILGYAIRDAIFRGTGR